MACRDPIHGRRRCRCWWCQRFAKRLRTSSISAATCTRQLRRRWLATWGCRIGRQYAYHHSAHHHLVIPRHTLRCKQQELTLPRFSLARGRVAWSRHVVARSVAAASHLRGEPRRAQRPPRCRRQATRPNGSLPSKSGRLGVSKAARGRLVEVGYDWGVDAGGDEPVPALHRPRRAADLGQSRHARGGADEELARLPPATRDGHRLWHLSEAECGRRGARGRCGERMTNDPTIMTVMRLEQGKGKKKRAGEAAALNVYVRFSFRQT